MKVFSVARLTAVWLCLFFMTFPRVESESSCNAFYGRPTPVLCYQLLYSASAPGLPGIRTLDQRVHGFSRGIIRPQTFSQIQWNNHVHLPQFWSVSKSHFLRNVMNNKLIIKASANSRVKLPCYHLHLPTGISQPIRHPT